MHIHIAVEVRIIGVSDEAVYVTLDVVRHRGELGRVIEHDAQSGRRLI